MKNISSRFLTQLLINRFIEESIVNLIQQLLSSKRISHVLIITNLESLELGLNFQVHHNNNILLSNLHIKVDLNTITEKNLDL